MDRETGMRTRRGVLLGGGAVAALAAVAGGSIWRAGPGGAAEAEAGPFAVGLTEAEWRERLSPQAYAVLREEATAPPFSSPLDQLKEAGVFHCAGCDQPLYASDAKYDSGTGWPSFWDSLPGAVGTRVDYKLIYPRTEVHCARCGGHLGHIFEDGPAPTGLRHCLNGVALAFQPATAA